MIERQEIHCHACDSWVQFEIDLGLNGNHVLACPKCQHEHCRVVKDGHITGERWDQRNGLTHYVTNAHVTTSSSMNTYMAITTATASTQAYHLYDSWMQTITTS